MASSTGPAVQIAMFCGAAYLLPPRRAWCRIDARGQCGKDRIDTLNNGIIAADHQAVASLRSPDPTAGSGVHIVNALRRQFGSAADVVVVVGVAAIDDDITLFEERDKRLQRLIDRKSTRLNSSHLGISY